MSHHTTSFHSDSLEIKQDHIASSSGTRFYQITPPIPGTNRTSSCKLPFKYLFSLKQYQQENYFQGYNTTLLFFHKPPLLVNQTNQVMFRFHEVNFRKPDGRRPTRDDVMTVLAYIDVFLIRMYPSKGSFAPSEAPIVMDASTQLGYHGLGKVTRIEECRCPHGYRGTSCELCDFGYHRVMRFVRTGACMPWEWHREEYYKVSTTTTMRNYHYV